MILFISFDDQNLIIKDSQTIKYTNLRILYWQKYKI